MVLRRIVKTNRRVDPRTVQESLALIDVMRSMGIKERGYNIFGSVESRLKVKGPVLFDLRS
jgi:hypothetical protein